MSVYTPPFDGRPCPMCPTEYRNLSALVHGVLVRVDSWQRYHESFQKRYAVLVQMLACDPPEITPETPPEIVSLLGAARRFVRGVMTTGGPSAQEVEALRDAQAAVRVLSDRHFANREHSHGLNRIGQ